METAQAAGAAFGLGMGALIMTIFGFTWLGWGFSAVETFTVTRWIIFYLAALALLAASIQALRRGKAQMKAHPAEGGDFGSGAQKKFRVIGMLEAAGCGMVMFLTVFFHRLDLLPLGISLVVGLHFIPLADLFHFRAYYATGIVIILCDVVSWAVFKADGITISVGLATGSILWLTAIYALARARKFSRSVATSG